MMRVQAAPRKVPAHAAPVDVQAFGEWRKIVSAFRPYIRQYRQHLIKGMAAAMGVVAIRVALPWLFRLLLKPVLKGDAPLSIGAIDPLLFAGGLIFLALLLWGFDDQLARVHFAKFSIGVTRLAQRRAAESLSAAGHGLPAGDVVSRMITDAARFRSGLKQFLVLVVVNGMLLVVSCAVLLFMDIWVGLIMFAASTGVFVITTATASRLYRLSVRKRKKAGKFAEKLHQRLLGEPIDELELKFKDYEGEGEALSTQIQGRATWIAYTLFGMAAVGALVVAVMQSKAGRLHQADVMVLMLYIFNMRAPIIRLTRQGCKSGPILGCAGRLRKLFSDAPEHHIDRPFETELKIEDLRIKDRSGAGRKYGLRIQDLAIRPGEKIAVIGLPGSGKSLLLKALGGIARPNRASVLWDDQQLDEDDLPQVSSLVYYLPQNPSWTRQKLSKLLGCTEFPPDRNMQKALSAAGLTTLLESLPLGLEASVASDDLSFTQRRSLALAQAVLADAPIVLLDAPDAGLEAIDFNRYLRGVSEAHSSNTLLVALSEASYADHFDRIIQLKRGKVRFDGTPAEWRTEREARKRAREEELLKVETS